MTTRKEWASGSGTKSSQICALHFPDEMFANLRQWREGFANGLRLEKGAMPSVLPKHVTPLRKQQRTKAEKAGTSQVQGMVKLVQYVCPI